MIFRIPEGKHYALPWRFGLWWRRPVFAWTVKFDDTCRYDLGTEDQFDTNKLIGVGYLPHHHTGSARFGWRYWPDTGQIELSAYCYVDKRRVIYHIALVEIGRRYRLHLSVTTMAYVFSVEDIEDERAMGGCSIPHFHRKKLQYRLGAYFGGNSVAPHEMNVQIEKH
mgnify:CR=1 FL=1